MSFLYRWSKTVQTHLFGPACVLCHGAAPLTHDLCADCQADLPWLDAACHHCALAMPTAATERVCRDCRCRPLAEQALAALHYRAPVDWLITRLKFNARMPHARVLGDLLAERIVASDLDRPDWLVPVPLHARNLRERGFNQAERIARRIAGPLDTPLAVHAVQRGRNTQRQSTLAASARRANVRDAFVCHHDLTGAHVAIVDDVVTTGHTARALAACLRRAGALRVDLYAVARA
ncbi:ComF family protein [Salinisphaera sp. T5B8]|uniref:ComF family protein n=1 Tax=Salinisphaera sp. T5B8 TaxID=1304154 RepID=UPI0033411F35